MFFFQVFSEAALRYNYNFFRANYYLTWEKWVFVYSYKKKSQIRTQIYKIQILNSYLKIISILMHFLITTK